MRLNSVHTCIFNERLASSNSKTPYTRCLYASKWVPTVSMLVCWFRLNEVQLMLVWKMPVEENSYSLFLDKTLSSLLVGLQTLQIHSPSITSSKKVEILRLPYVRSHAPCWLSNVIFACMYKCCYSCSCVAIRKITSIITSVVRTRL